MKAGTFEKSFSVSPASKSSIFHSVTWVSLLASKVPAAPPPTIMKSKDPISATNKNETGLVSLYWYLLWTDDNRTKKWDKIGKGLPQEQW